METNMTPKTIIPSLFILLALCTAKAGAQNNSVDSMATVQPVPDSTKQPATDSSQKHFSDSLAADRINKNKTNMTILAAWAGINIIQGSISATNAQGSDRYFFRMNSYWNLVNLGIATYGLVMVRKQLQKTISFKDNFREQQKTEKILLLNTGLDAAYIATGLFLKERGARLASEQNSGFGNSLILQGAFLLVFDLVQYGNHRKNGKLLEQQMGNLQLTTTANGIGIAYHIK